MAKVKTGGKPPLEILLGDEKTTLNAIADICNVDTGIRRTYQFYYARWKAIGSPRQIQDLKWFTMPPIEFKEAQRRKKIETCGQPKTDLSHIPAGDLAHLSGTKRRATKDSAACRSPRNVEGKYFPEAGKAGFSQCSQNGSFAGTTGHNIPVYNGRQ